MHLCFLRVAQDCDKFQSKSLVSPTPLVSAPSGCLRVMEPRNAEHRGLPWDACRTRCRLSSGEHLKINNINDDFSLLVTSVCALRSDAITLAGMQSLPPSASFRDGPRLLCTPFPIQIRHRSVGGSRLSVLNNCRTRLAVIIH